MGTPLGPKYIPYTYMDPLGMLASFAPGFGPMVSGMVLCQRQRLNKSTPC